MGIAAGVYLFAALLVLFGYLSPSSSIWLWATPIISGVFLGLTGGLLLWDLEHPERFYLIFTRPQWRSWLVKGAFIIAGYSLVLLLHFVAVPRFYWSGMENTSLIFVRDNKLVLDHKNELSGKSRIVGLFAHETAHQWFGNDVTLKW